MNIYKAGLNNVGSYLVSGRPWLKTSTIADGAIEFYHLPNVAKEITIRNDHQRAGHNLSVAFPEPRRAVDMPDGDENFQGSFTELETLSVSLWFNFNYALATIRMLDLRDSSGNSIVRIQSKSANELRLAINNGAIVNTGAVLVRDTWFQLTVTINKSTDTVLVYLNGSQILSSTSTALSDGIAQIRLGAGGTNFDGLYSDATLFNTDLSAPECAALFNGVGNIDPRDHSKSANLVSWWAFEDNHFKNYFDIADTGTTIQDRVGSNNLTIDTGAATFTLGRHYASIFNENRSHLLTGADELTIEAKTTFVAVKCAGGNLDYSIHASLTGIDRSRTQGTGLYD